MSSPIKSSIEPWQVPQSVPAPQASPTASTEHAPRSTTFWIAVSERPLQMQTIMG